MEGFYWKRRDSYWKPDYYVSPEGKVLGELTESRESNTWRASVWSESDRHFITLGIYIAEELAKSAVEQYCEDKY
jgi:hypothetical protein